MECSESSQNISSGSNSVDRCICSKKMRCDFIARTWVLTTQVSPGFQRRSCNNETMRNAAKHEFGVQWRDRTRLLRKIQTRLHCANLCINGTSLAPFCAEVRTVTENGLKHPKTWVLSPMGWIGCVHCEKFRRDFIAWFWALITPLWLVFPPKFV
jgi:hypothetical protein